jgi:hypothetical protein
MPQGWTASRISLFTEWIKENGVLILPILVVELVLDRVDDRDIAMAEAGNRGTAGGIEVMLALAVDDVNAVSLYRQQRRGLAVSREYVAHNGPGAQLRNRVPSGSNAETKLM